MKVKLGAVLVQVHTLVQELVTPDVPAVAQEVERVAVVAVTAAVLALLNLPQSRQ